MVKEIETHSCFQWSTARHMWRWYSTKELVWQHKNKKALSLIGASVTENVNWHINNLDTKWGTLKELKDLYDLHLELEFMQLQLKLFNLEMKDNDPLSLASKINVMKHGIKVIGGQVDITRSTSRPYSRHIHTILNHYKQVDNSRPSFFMLW